ncbi:hypothetical protein [Mesobacillus foraminis]|uniref:Uncharacterized protein n=1 Tax=Mesobacillus foraminis TaxID=279826 RepID=A0A4V2RDK2_9BACI|nr:hypothetical protein [Mesobacillus foraminis]TCN25170.1 hypothetical protein EV146_106374 [Mesobacillus foraminis]
MSGNVSENGNPKPELIDFLGYIIMPVQKGGYRKKEMGSLTVPARLVGLTCLTANEN